MIYQLQISWTVSSVIALRLVWIVLGDSSSLENLIDRLHGCISMDQYDMQGIGSSTSLLVIEKPNINVSRENIIHAIFTVELSLFP